MMREITIHQGINSSIDDAIRIEADERDPNNGNASHRYTLAVGTDDDPHLFELQFQHGPIQEAGVNGITNEALLAIVIDRLEGFQAGPYVCEENERALRSALYALNALQDRTRARIARGVEGTHEV